MAGSPEPRRPDDWGDPDDRFPIGLLLAAMLAADVLMLAFVPWQPWVAINAIAALVTVFDHTVIALIRWWRR